MLLSYGTTVSLVSRKNVYHVVPPPPPFSIAQSRLQVPISQPNNVLNCPNETKFRFSPNAKSGKKAKSKISFSAARVVIRRRERGGGGALSHMQRTDLHGSML